jgi:protein MpaA
MTRAAAVAAACCLVATLAGCSSDAADPAGDASTAVSTTLSPVTTVRATTTSRPTTTVPATVPSTSTSTTTTTTPITAAPTTVAPTPTTVAPSGVATTSAPDDFLGEETIGSSVEGRPIVASHRGTPGGTVVLVVGVIHGNENAGLAILDDLRTMPVPVGIDLWLMDAINPDGLANDVRGNGNQVDLNRNFPHDWTQVAQVGEWEYSGTGPASEPETQAFIAFAERIQPTLTLWYHQDLNRISPSNRKDGPLRERYSQLTGLPILSVTGGTYTGVAATWTRLTVPDAMSFIVELGPSLSADDAVVHAVAVLDIAVMAAAIG